MTAPKLFDSNRKTKVGDVRLVRIYSPKEFELELYPHEISALEARFTQALKETEREARIDELEKVYDDQHRYSAEKAIQLLTIRIAELRKEGGEHVS